MSARFADLSLAQIGQRLLRYRPVAAAGAVTLTVLIALPDSGSAGPQPVAAAQPTAVAAPPATKAAVTTTTVAPPPPTASPVTSAQTSTAAAPAPIAEQTPAQHSTAPSPPPTLPSPSTTAPPRSVADTTWATTGAGTPAATAGVPEGTLPVGTRVGDVDKASFLRLMGSWETLELTADPVGERASVGEATVQACAVTTPDWEAGAAESFDDAPSWNPDDCAVGTTAGERWTFPLGAVDITNGVALVPGPDAPVDFQVSFITPS